MDLIYAVPEDITDAWLPAVPDNAAALIRNASELMSDATSVARYEHDDDGFPTDLKVIDAFNRAVLRQVTMWSKAGIDPEAGVAGAKPIVASQSAGGGSVSYVTGSSQADVKAAIEKPCAGALRVLRAAGLLSHMPQVY